MGRDFKDQEAFIGSECHKLQRLEFDPQRWPLARLSISLQKCVDHLDHALAGCCWEVHATRADPEESLSMLLAGCLAKEVAAILRDSDLHFLSFFSFFSVLLCFILFFIFCSFFLLL